MSKEFQDELLKKLPTEPPEGLLDWWLQAHETDKNNAIVYRAEYVWNPLTEMKEKMVRCTCTACGQSVYMEYVPADCCCSANATAPFGYRTVQGEVIYRGMDALCSECGAEVKVYHCGDMGSSCRVLITECPITIEKIDDSVCFFMWCLEKIVFRDGSCKYRILPYEVFAFTKSTWYMFRGWVISFYQECLTGRWSAYRCRNSGLKPWPLADIYGFDNEVFSGTALENAKVDLFLSQSDSKKTFLIPYLCTYLKHKQIENLVVQKQCRLINDAIERSALCQNNGKTIERPVSSFFDWKQSKPCAMLGLNKEEFRLIQSEEWSLDMLRSYKRNRKIKKPIPITEFSEAYKLLKGHGINSLIDDNQDIRKIFRYLKKQRIKYPDTGIELWHLTDYWRLAPQVQIPLETENDYFPKNIKKAHGRCVEILNERREADYFAKEAKQRAAFAVLKEAYTDFAFEADGFCIFIASAPAELREEGRNLRHCVGGYVNTHAKGKECIFFLRRSEAPGTSFYTLTLDTEKLVITMNLGYVNCDPTKEVKEFSQKWLEYIKGIRSSKDERKHKYNRNAECA